MAKNKKKSSMTKLSENPQSNGIFRFNGPSHEQGGIPIQYANQGVEVEGDETGYIDLGGDLNIFGNMKIPGTDMKFKNFAKKIAKKEQKATKKLNKSVDLINTHDPYNSFGRLSFNSGMVMGQAAQSELEQLTLAKEATAQLQDTMLENDMQRYYGEARRGMKLAQDGAQTKPKAFGPNTPWWQKILQGGANAVRLPQPNMYPGMPQPVPLPQPNLEQMLGPNFVPYNASPSLPPSATLPPQVTQALADTTAPVKGRKQTLAIRHNNPGNLKYAPWMKAFGAEPGEMSKEKDPKHRSRFAKFPDTVTGQKAMVELLKKPLYQKKTVADAIKTWTGGESYSKIPEELKTKKVADLDPNQFKSLLDTITQGEDSKKYNWDGADPVPTGAPANPSVDTLVNTPTLLTQPRPAFPDNPAAPPPKYTGPVTPPRTLEPLVPPDRRKRPPIRNPLRPSQLIGEALTLATERPEFVPGLRYEPQLYQPYQVSFQDRLNENNASFRAISQQLPGNASAQATLAGQKYRADSQVLSDQFRTNQGITNEVTNKNVALINDASVRNLGYLDQQLVRSSQARSNTRENVRNAINSVAGKFEQNRLETLGLNVAANLFPNYSYDRYGRLDYNVGDVPTFTGGNNPNATNAEYYTRERREYTDTGALRKTVQNEPSDAEKAKIDHDQQMREIKSIYEPSKYYQNVTKGFTDYMKKRRY